MQKSILTQWHAHLWCCCAALLCAANSVLAQDYPADQTQQLMRAVSSQTLKEHVIWLADDKRMGRDTPSPELDESAHYIARFVDSLGLKPLGNSFLLPYTVSRTDLDTIHTSCEIDGKTMPLGSAFIPFMQTDTGKVQSSNLVFAGFGIDSEEYAYNDYEGLDVSGAVVVVVAGEPDSLTDKNSEGKRRRRQSWYSYTQTKIAVAAEKGAQAIVILRSTEHKGWSRSFAPRWPSLLGVDMSSSKVSLDIVSQPAVPAFTGNETLVEALFGSMSSLDSAISRWTTGDRNAHLWNNTTIRLQIRFVREQHTVYNVAAVLPGNTQPERYVVLGAHYDHVGHSNPMVIPGEPVGESIDSIFNGADDNASGSAAVMSVAEAFVKSNAVTDRSIVFLWFSGEEKGLYGSRAFVEQSHIPIDRIDAMLNVDMVGRNAEDSLSIGGALRCAELTIENERVNELLDNPFVLSYDIESYFFRSDQANFARYGIPVLFFFSGEHEDYHQPGDEIQKIRFGKATRAAQLCAGTLLRVANSTTRFPYTPQPADIRFKTR